MTHTKLHASFILIFQIVLLILFGFFTKYNEKSESGIYPMFQDIHVMMFIGFGFLMTFLRRYSYSAVGFNFLLAALMVQWALICEGFYELDNYRIEINVLSLVKADIAAATVLISMGAVLGRTSYMQLLIMGVIEMVIFTGNSYLGSHIFKVSDAGGSIFVHTFGAYFGLSAGYILDRKKDVTSNENSLESARYTSDVFAMIGTVFLWLFWPSFNAAEVTGDDQQRAILNTYLALASCCVTTFAVSVILTHNHKFDMVHIQNSTLAGGVAVGTSANLMLQPFGALIVGVIAAILSVFGYEKLTPWLRKRLDLSDTCGVHNLHGMPGVLAGLIGVLMAGIANETTYKQSLYEIYPARASPNITVGEEYHYIHPGEGRTAGQQAGYQALAIAVTMAIAIVSGLVTGLVLKLPVFNNLESNNFYEDAIAWTVPEQKQPDSPHQYDNRAFDDSQPSGTNNKA